MYPGDTNAFGCPLHDQTGPIAVQNFDDILASLTPELRAAFEQERAERQGELDTYVKQNNLNS